MAKHKTIVYHNGLAVEVEIYSAPATPPSYASGGDPPEWDMEILSVSLDDAEELAEYLETDVEDFSNEMLRILARNWKDEIEEEVE